jgi:hypothetical protein
MPGICGALKEVIYYYSLFPVIIQEAEVLVLVHNYTGWISWGYQTLLLLSDNIDISLYIDGIRYTRADSRETLYKKHFNPLGGRNI